jgi:hypothetical protein
MCHQKIAPRARSRGPGWLALETPARTRGRSPWRRGCILPQGSRLPARVEAGMGERIQLCRVFFTSRLRLLLDALYSISECYPFRQNTGRGRETLDRPFGREVCR